MLEHRVQVLSVANRHGGMQDGMQPLEQCMIDPHTGQPKRAAFGLLDTHPVGPLFPQEKVIGVVVNSPHLNHGLSPKDQHKEQQD